MPSKSRAQQRLMQAAEHGADFPLARTLRASMTHAQLHDFSVGSEKGKPQHVPEHKTRKAQRERAALRATTESYAYSNRDRRRR